MEWSVGERLLFAAALLSLPVACAGYATPAASDPFFTTPFRSLAPEVNEKIGAAPRRPVAAARARRTKEPPVPPPTTPPSDLAPIATATPEVLRPAAMVESALHRRGVRFGTDGTVDSLLAYLRHEHALVPLHTARPGDVLFFRIYEETCADHAGVVESVDATGRITFQEVRAGAVRTSYVHPSSPASRRGFDGRINNSFLRPRRTDDPPVARYFAGEMLCAVGRIRR